MKKVCEIIGYDAAIVHKWREEDTHFDREFVRARDDGYDAQADQLLEIPDTYEDVNKARLKSDNLKWVLARRASAKYGDKITMDVNQTLDISGALGEARARIRDVAQTQDAQAIDTARVTQGSTTSHEDVDPIKIASDDDDIFS